VGVITVPVFAAQTITPPGEAAGQTQNARGLASDFETGRLYVADRDNNRVDVLDSAGAFQFAFGWGVISGKAKFEVCTTATGCRAGLPGTGAGQFSGPTEVAVDNDPASSSQHDIYVIDGSSRVQKFDSSGNLLLSFGTIGTGKCELGRAKGRDPIAVGPGGTVYIADSAELGGLNFRDRVERFDASGNCIDEVTLLEGNVAIRSLAVDSNGDLYVVVEGEEGVVRKYDASGTPLYELDKGNSASSLAIDADDNLFAQQVEGGLEVITEYDSAGNHLSRFGYGTIDHFLPALAAQHNTGTPTGDVFGTEEGLVKLFEAPPPGPVLLKEPCKVKPGTLGNTHATLQAKVNPEGKATSFHFVYSSAAGTKASAEAPLPGAADFTLHEAAVKVEELEPETEYHCHVVAKDSEGNETTGEDGIFKTGPPFEFGPTWTSGVGTDTATINAEGNPLGIPAKGQFEYVEDAKYQVSEFAEALSGPAVELDYGAEETMQLRSGTLTGLKPGTLYHYRLRIKNGSPPEGIVCPEGKPSPCPENEHTFRTFAAKVSALPDGRAYELVSPGQKNTAEVAVPGVSAGTFEDSSIRIQAGAGSGEAITYTSFTSFGEADSAPAASQYLSKRTPTGWATENISTLGRVLQPGFPPFTGFTPELGFGAVNVDEPAVTPDCPEGHRNLYLRNSATGTLQCLTPEPSTSGFECFVFAGASDDGTHAFFASESTYAGTEPGPEPRNDMSLYEWSAEHGLRAVSVLPGQSKPAIPTIRTSFGALGSVSPNENCPTTGQRTLHHVVSADGRTVFWTYAPEVGTPKLMARINGEETIQIDAKVPSGEGGGGSFLAASADGSRAFFTAPGKLNSEAKAAGQLYRYDTVGRSLTDLTPGTIAPEIQGVLGAADDGSAIYFVAKAVLTGTQESDAHEKAEAGKDNLYLYREGEGLRFIAVLAPEDPSDAADWSSQPRDLSARVSADGNHLAFLSIEAERLAGYDNRVAVGEHCHWNPLLRRLDGNHLCPQAFVYDAATDTLTCASCNPAGSRPLGPTLLPAWTNVYEGPHYLADDGSRLFFESFDALSLGDETAKRDVYEFERSGAGSCNASDPSFDPAVGGCHFLISSGRSSDETYLVDASTDGRDALFVTRSELLDADPNQNYDIYDARVGGGFAEAGEAPVCVGEGCKAPALASPTAVTPGTAAFQGPPNPPAKHKKKNSTKHKKKSKHKGKGKRHGKKKHGRANQKRRAQR
jgi:hypothetical protein